MTQFWLNELHTKHEGKHTPETEERFALLSRRGYVGKRGRVKEYQPYFSFAHDATYLMQLQQETLVATEAECNRGSYQAIASYAALCLEAADTIVQRNTDDIFIIGRPPGHHAHYNWTHGFCFINNAAVTALYLQSLQKSVAVLDFDLHHGEGTEEILNRAAPDSLLFISTYDAGNFPGKGYNLTQETHQGNTYHLPLTSLTDDSSFVSTIQKIEQKLEQFNPEVLVVSAGFDMNRHDSTSRIMQSPIKLTQRSYERLYQVCNKYPFIGILEGGYSPRSVQEGLKAFGLNNA